MLQDLIPARYYGTPGLREMWDAIDVSLEAAQNALLDFFAQLNVDTATWALALYERDYGLTPNVSATYAERRAQLKSRMRVAGTSTTTMILNLAAAYSGGETKVDDLAELFTLAVTFTGTIGVPSNMADLQAAVTAARPAHMAVRYIIRYNLWRAVKSKTWSELAARTWHNVKEVAL